MENKILDFWFGPVFCGPTKLAQITALEATKIEAEIQYDRWSTPECEKCENISTSSECVFCHEIQAVNAFYLKSKARLYWIAAVLKFFSWEFYCVGNHVLEEFFSEIS